jgi:formylglycine-generating enzyme required for sulfatase activity
MAALDTAIATFWTATPTSTPTPTPTPTPRPGYSGGIRIENNRDWTPIGQDFNGVKMMLVPKGCFLMGDDLHASWWWNNKWTPSVPNGGQQCFDEPFWIDLTEVTNQQFNELGGQADNNALFKDANRPRERITWIEAREFCIRRNMRLPTEAEWEYAARGPDNLIFPWGNEFISGNVVYDRHSSLDVGSRPMGASWVGAVDMSGNVGEWVSSIYALYPYDRYDGREQIDDNNVLRARRGESWKMPESLLRATTRNGNYPNGNNYFEDVGFRCARDFQPGDLPLYS